jgi:PqqD family protein of HPr-rel-A system
MTDNEACRRENQIGPDFVAHPRREVVTAEIDGDAVIYDELLGATHLLNPTAAIVWGLLDGETRLDELSADLAEAFGVDVGEVLADVVMIVGELGRRGLLEDVAAEDAGTGNLRRPPAGTVAAHS